MATNDRFSVRTMRLPDGTLLRYCSRFSDGHVQSLNRKLAMVSGGYDPLHEGHLANIFGAAALGPVLVIANGDGFLKRKRAMDPLLPAPLLPLSTRMATLAALDPVVLVVESIDEDQTVCATIEALSAVPWLQPQWFCNGGDRRHGNVPEEAICEAADIELIWNCGGSDKKAESSRIATRAALIGASTVAKRRETRWGADCTIIAETDTLVKLLSFNPGKGVSLQTHHHRSEEWWVMEGEGLLMLGKLDANGVQEFEDGMPRYGEIVQLTPGVHATIALGQAHMVVNTGNEPLLVKETWHGEGTSEEDIIRFGDPFNRPEDWEACYAWLVHPALTVGRQAA